MVWLEEGGLDRTGRTRLKIWGSLGVEWEGKVSGGTRNGELSW